MILSSAPPLESSRFSLSPSVNLLLIDNEEATAKFGALLRRTYRVAVSSSVALARDFLRRSPADLIVTELELRDGSGADVCREAKALATAPSVLVITDNVERAPEALEACCDSILLKPFAPNLLIARVGRLLRHQRSSALRERSGLASVKAQHLLERSQLLIQGTHRVWPATHCPHCDRREPISFEFAGRRQAWYACLACKQVWLGKRQE